MYTPEEESFRWTKSMEFTI